mmetsp:Transcript_4670/g.10122  ORF Transcript_4670/g.10122 Transcript_4670/m.10122 type:complete len:774 (+) Transcript_4670:212-2533(+)|eukprot:CAMPEP_0202906062 /NCGR_PEP_ID=MMETSP1392-20130828/37200_1 /ASSEMBLY_ACC=CAM_ASM_000868 /TAXON_ID=225041 /ORGANISM="Chlamydomonas chlamydogama, Strain SAG 11-48b" /LENGTH=773 /DNA_ID=CAMNT_0049594419 /DNA_START=204 /DNA_END=2528 /DNA_ORIENTATION=-
MLSNDIRSSYGNNLNSNSRPRSRNTGLLSRLFGPLSKGKQGRRRQGNQEQAEATGSMCEAAAAPVYQVREGLDQAQVSAFAPGVVATTEEASFIDMGYSKGFEENYIIGSELGKGGNGCVRVVTDKSNSLDYACKSIPKVLGENFSEKKRSTHLESLRREVQVLTKLRGCLNIVELHDVYEDETHVHIVMEQCKGGELWHRIGDRHYSERTVASFMRGVLRTLAVMHSHHILHRDIKPGNFMLLNDADRSPLKAIDFGLAMPYEPESLPRTDLGLEGTPWYMAPETLSSQVLPASDVWAAGVMAHQLLTGRFPFDDRRNPSNPAVSAIWKSILVDPLDLDKPHWAGISAEGKDFVRRLLERDPAKRPTAKEALEHPWLRGNSSERSTGKRLALSVVQRIQRFAQGSMFKRTMLQAIAAELMSSPLDDMHDSDVCYISSKGQALVPTPNSACLEPIFKKLHLDEQDTVETAKLGEAIKALGYKLEPNEVERLLEQVDLQGTGEVDKAAFAASQVDWKELQQQHKERWIAMVRRTFASLDQDNDGVLKASEIIEALGQNLPESEVKAAVEQAMQEAGQPPDAEGMDFKDFMQMLRVSSIDSLDMYDDRAGGSTHHHKNSPRASIDQLNAMLQKSPSVASSLGMDASRHGASWTTALLADDSVHSDTATIQDKSSHDRSQHGTGGALFKEGAPPPAAASFFRFDVDTKAGSAGSQSAAVPVPHAGHAPLDAAPAAPTVQDVVQAVGTRGGYYDRRHHGSSLYKNSVLSHTLPTVRE